MVSGDQIQLKVADIQSLVEEIWFQNKHYRQSCVKNIDDKLSDNDFQSAMENLTKKVKESKEEIENSYASMLRRTGLALVVITEPTFIRNRTVVDLTNIGVAIRDSSALFRYCSAIGGEASDAARSFLEGNAWARLNVDPHEAVREKITEVITDLFRLIFIGFKDSNNTITEKVLNDLCEICLYCNLNQPSAFLCELYDALNEDSLEDFLLLDKFISACNIIPPVTWIPLGENVYKHQLYLYFSLFGRVRNKQSETVKRIKRHMRVSVNQFMLIHQTNSERTLQNIDDIEDLYLQYQRENLSL